MVGGVTWKYGSPKASCDDTCLPSENGVSSCVEDGFKTKWSEELMKKALVEPSAGLGRASAVECTKYEPMSMLQIHNVTHKTGPLEMSGICYYNTDDVTHQRRPTCAAQAPSRSEHIFQSRLLCPCRCPFGTTAKVGTTRPCET